ncbi:hypothetical protein HY449_00595 [Candidatus Pacearchaeota archaeon]|nr:hypothetical protein [Candidatus Pacearchaeota archaeon]
METNEFKIINQGDLKKLMEDVALIKEILFFNSNIKDPEGKLSDWAKKELKEARETPEEEYVSLEAVKKRILSKK